MRKPDVVSLVIMGLLCVMSMANTVWMVIINHPDLAMISALFFATFSLAFMYETRNK
jgi:hypothetical protein